MNPIKRIKSNHSIKSFSTYTRLNLRELSFEFKTDLQNGLSDEESRRRFNQSGPNEIHSNSITGLKILGRQLSSPFIYLLFAACFLALFLGELLDGVMILIFIGMNTFFGFYQEYRSEKALKVLKTLVVKHAKVVRNGQEQLIPAVELVIGDVVVVDAGDIVPADIRIFDQTDLLIDESALTGESDLMRKTESALQKPVRDIFAAKNMIFSQTTVVNGRGRGVVVSTGLNSVFGNTAELAFETPHKSGFERGIGSLSRFVLYMILLTLGFVILANLLLKGLDANIPDLLIFAIALAVSVIPEALPVVTTFSLSQGALRLAKKKVVVKRLSAIEDLGGIEVLCTDKTGTLTKNEMTVVDWWGKDRQDLLFWANLNAFFLSGKKITNSFDLALSREVGTAHQKEFESFGALAIEPFDPRDKFDAVLVKRETTESCIIRGAPEEILKRCEISQNDEALDWMAKAGLRGQRVLGVALKETDGKSKGLHQMTKGMQFLGLIAFADPLKETTIDAVKKAEKLGIVVKILTGDSIEVAGAVGHQIGLIDSPDKVLSGAQWDSLGFADREKSALETAVFARVNPAQKHEIVNLLRQKFEVGFLGEGMNDAPALKVASIGLVVSGASDIAREAADIVLLEKSLHVIIEGVNEGRMVFANTVKYIKSTFTSNFGNFYAVAIASLIIDYLPMLPVQILLVNLLSDFPAISISTDSVDHEELERPRAYNLKEIALLASFLGIVSTVFDFIFFGLYYKISPATLQTNWFIASILTELALLYSIRTKRIFFKAKRPALPTILISGIAGLLTVILPFTNFGQTVFQFARPQISHLLTIGLLIGVYFFASELVKLLFYRMGWDKDANGGFGLKSKVGL